MGSRFIEDKTISYIHQIRKSTKNELFIDYSELFLNDEDIELYIKNVINENSKKIIIIKRIIKKYKKYTKCVGNTDSSAITRVYCRYITNLYSDVIIRHLFLIVFSL
jgi:hypothetical protein